MNSFTSGSLRYRAMVARAPPARPASPRTGGLASEEGRSSFSEEKEAKRLHPLFIARRHGTPVNESFLVLFFKKEHLSS
ncbi:MAG: hypothetical protein IT555_02830, partial [Acetobacteraceae bacterium]|nr:hypothetical protein [Acetobacteraceae bacterium]